MKNTAKPIVDLVEKGFVFVEDAGRGYRRVVPSPIPKRIVELEAVNRLVESGAIVITVGGGGIPVVEAPRGAQGRGGCYRQGSCQLPACQRPEG